MNGDTKDLRITVAVHGSGAMASSVPLVPLSSSVASVAVIREVVRIAGLGGAAG